MENNNIEKDVKNTNKATGLWVVFGIAVLILIVVAIIASKNKIDDATQENGSTNEVVPGETESVQDSSGDGQGAVSPAISLSYAEALIKYADRRIQFDKNCQAYPNTVTYKDNTGIMLDNRAPETRTIKVGVNYTVKGYGFKIVILPDIYLNSKTLLVDCDKSQNVATILVQE